MKRLAALILSAAVAETAACAQTLANGSFESGFSDWTLSGIPTVVGAPPTPINGSSQALIQSTGAAGTGSAAPGNAVDAATLQSFLGISTLPSTRAGAAVNGEAISQTFTVSKPMKLTFSFNYQTRELDGLGFDAAGYVLNGVFHELANGDSPNLTSANGAGNFAIGSGYSTVTVVLTSGVNTISFVTYNTGNNATDTGLYVDDLNLSTASFRHASFTPNQNAAAGYIDQFSGTVTTGNFGKLVNNLGALGAADLATAFDEISPQSLQVFHRIAFDNATFTSQGMDDHFAALRDGLTGFDSSGLAINDPTLAPTLSQINSRLLAWSPPTAPGLLSDSPTPLMGGTDLRDPKKMTESRSNDNKWSAFVTGNVVLADIGHSDAVAHQDYTIGSVMLGADYRVCPNFTVGALLGYGHTDANLDHDGSSATADTYSPGVYATFVDGPWYANGLFSYGYNSYTEDRHVAIGDVSGFNHGAPDGNQFTGNLSTGYEMTAGGFKFGPMAGLQYVNLGINSFTEDGPTALNVQEQSAESLRSQLGFEGRYALRAGGVELTPHASASWMHEFLDGSEGITSQFNQIGAGSFTVQTTSAGRDSALLDLGLNAGINETVTLFVDYQTEVGESDFFAQSVQAGVKLGF